MLAAVAIGRNEGERLKRCLRSLCGRVERIVYVDSGSVDDSVGFARSIGARVIALDADVPFTMARARNAGFEVLAEQHPELEFVQFVDGDCEIAAGWIEEARELLASRADAAVVCGRRKERFPEASIYNRLIDMEWNRPTGEVSACGGDAMMRVEALRKVGGFDPRMIAGEEAELCCRLRLAGWKVLRLGSTMTLHDAAMHSFRQWWKRSVRGGHAFAEGAHLHGGSVLRHNVRPLGSALVWGLLAPVALAACGVLFAISAVLPRLDAALPGALGIGLAGAYTTLGVRVFRSRRRSGDPRSEAWLYAGFCVLGKLPELIGALRFYRNRNRTRQLIEYK